MVYIKILLIWLWSFLHNVCCSILSSYWNRFERVLKSVLGVRGKLQKYELLKGKKRKKSSGETLHAALILLYPLPSFQYCYQKCMYLCILQRKQQVFYFLRFAWHLHWTRPCHWFLIWELNTNPQLSILANVISCWINEQCFCWGEGWITGAVSYNSLKLDWGFVLLKEKVPSRFLRKSCL